jgi:orotidine-5'-phosphate decarboxylase
MDSKQLIVALDYNDRFQALQLIDQLDPQLCALKIGSELFSRTGPEFVRALVKQGYRIFLDLKFHDIPNTVAPACAAAADLGVWMVNVHASGGLAMLNAARQAIITYGLHRPYLIAVTVLTSLTEADLARAGIQGTLLEHVERLAVLAQEAGLDGVVCSAWETAQLKARCGQTFLTVTPGIRLPGDVVDDQVRVMTPQQALAVGSDFLVVGRSITRAADPAAVVKKLLSIP